MWEKSIRKRSGCGYSADNYVPDIPRVTALFSFTPGSFLTVYISTCAMPVQSIVKSVVYIYTPLFPLESHRIQDDWSRSG